MPIHFQCPVSEVASSKVHVLLSVIINYGKNILNYAITGYLSDITVNFIEPIKN